MCCSKTTSRRAWSSSCKRRYKTPRAPTAPDITDKELALKLGVDKSDVRGALRRLTRVGVVEVSSGFVLIKDNARLAEFLDFIRNSGAS